MKRSIVLILITLGLSGPLAAAEDGSFSVKAELDKAFVTIGERIEYRVTITHGADTEVVSKVVPPPSDAFEVKEAHDIYEKQGKQTVEGRRFMLTTYELGEFILDPVAINYKTKNGEEKSVQTNQLYLTVRSVDSSGKPKTDIRGPKGVIDLKQEWYWLFVVGFLILVLSVGGYIWWQWKHKKTRSPSEQEVILSPEDEAMVNLYKLFDSDLIKRGKLKEYFLELSEVMRHYFERRFQIVALESTTLEILRDLREKEVSQELRKLIQEVLDTADLVKFAKWKPASNEIVRVNQQAKAIVEQARPKAEVITPGETVSQITYGI